MTFLLICDHKRTDSKHYNSDDRGCDNQPPNDLYDTPEFADFGGNH